ncbi:MAG: hypothetical protein ASARMPRED_004718 [Alectoria sarmentosa]|nr:MAG: hypothetical protein ASARMPRED_004718 [Alectoria sarmentosa]
MPRWTQPLTDQSPNIIDRQNSLPTRIIIPTQRHTATNTTPVTTQFLQLTLDQSPISPCTRDVLSLREGTNATKERAAKRKTHDVIGWQIDLGVIQGPAGKARGAVSGAAVGDVDEGAYVVGREGFQVGGTEEAAAAVDAEGIIEKGGVEAERLDGSKEDCEEG